MDGGLMGAGAQPTGDGLDGSGMTTQVSNMVPDVEMNELMYPVLYLWKRLDDETGGPGAQRGGLGVDYAWTLWNCDEVLHTVFCPCAQVPAGGYGGGYPGGGGEQSILRETDVRDALAHGQRRCKPSRRRSVLELTAQGLVIRAGDVFRQRIAGGGGYGDPLLRAPEAVAADLRDGYITARGAEAAYGVRVDDDGPRRRSGHARTAALAACARGSARSVVDVRDAPEPGLSVTGGPDGVELPAVRHRARRGPGLDRRNRAARAHRGGAPRGPRHPGAAQPRRARARAPVSGLRLGARRAGGGPER